MDIIINEELKNIPSGSRLIMSDSDWASNFLLGLDYKPNLLPLGNFLAQYHGLEGNWLVVDPVYWVATHNDAMILAYGHNLNLTEKESQQFFQDIQEFFKEEKMQWHYHSKNRWLLKKDNKPSINTKPTFQMMHESLMPALNAMDSSMYWQRFMTEAQMFLSNHPLANKLTTAPFINGLWVFGEGIFQFPQDFQGHTDDQQLLDHFASYFHAAEAIEMYKTTCIVLSSAQALPENLPNVSTTWRWNNVAYTIKKRNLWTRFWRFITHANKKKKRTY